MEFLMQPIRRTAVMEEVNDNEVPMEAVRYPVLAAVAEELPPMAMGSVDGQICAMDGAVAGGQGDEAQASELSIGQVDPKTPGWTCRRDSHLHVVNYIREFTGLYIYNPLTPTRLHYFRQMIAYEVISMRGNRAELPDFMVQVVPF